MGGRGIRNNAEIWHYDGNSWTQNFSYNVDEAYTVEVYNIWGSEETDIYACGIISYVVENKDIWRGFVLHYDGSTAGSC